MDTAQRGLIREARSIYRTIFPCGGRTSFAECFTEDEGKLIFWFDTADHSTHVMMGNLAA